MISKEWSTCAYLWNTKYVKENHKKSLRCTTNTLNFMHSAWVCLAVKEMKERNWKYGKYWLFSNLHIFLGSQYFFLYLTLFWDSQTLLSYHYLYFPYSLFHFPLLHFPSYNQMGPSDLIFIQHLILFLNWLLMVSPSRYHLDTQELILIILVFKWI